MVRKKSLLAKLTPIQKAILGIVVVGGGTFLIVDAYGCSLKDGVDMATLNQADFLYGDFMPLFCDLSDYNDSEDIGVLVDEYIFGGTEDLELSDLVPPAATLNEVIAEDPDGVMFEIDEGDIIISDEQLEMLEEIQNQTSTNDPLIGNNVTEILDESPGSGPTEPPPEEITQISEFVFITQVKKIFTDLSEETVTNEFQFIPLSVFVEDTSNKDISNGRFETELFIRTDPITFVEGGGEFDVLIDNMTSSSTVSASIVFSGTSDTSGMLRAQFIGPSGLPSDTFILSVAPLEPELKTNGITTLDFVITDLLGTINEVEYGVSNGVVFTFDIFRQPNQILVTDSQGNEVRAFPTDDQLRIGAVDGSVRTSRCYKHTRYACWMTSVYYSPLGSPTIASVEVRNSAGDLLFQNLSPFTKTYIINNELIMRNDTYTVNYGRVTSSAGSLPAGSFQFTTPETQMNYNYRCTLSQASAPVGSGFCSKCLTPSGPVSLSCNFPS